MLTSSNKFCPASAMNKTLLELEYIVAKAGFL
jgi:hypothetical protein